MKRIELGFFDAGGGHRAAAEALEIAVRAEQRSWDTHLLNLQELLDPLDILKKHFGIRIQDFYNSLLRNGWTLGSPQLLRVLQLVIRLNHRSTVGLMEAHWKQAQPEMLVSFVPHFNRALGESFAKAFPERPFVTILTDLADYPPHFWIENHPRQYLICGTQRAISQARQMGHPDDHIFRASGMILHPRFYEAPLADPIREREHLGLLPNLPTGLVLFGGHGSKAMLEIAARLERSALDLQLIFVCGKNEKLARALGSQRSRLPRFVEGFTTRVNYYMQLADFFIGKPGPGSISEALAMHLPVIVECNRRTLPQERYNAEWIVEKHVGIVLRNFRGIEHAVAQLIEPAALVRYRTNAAAVKNRAIFEIPAILEQILKRPGNDAMAKRDAAVAGKLG
ncbi:MAG TPA: glycosyltransferase [Candidatus Acidoferrales bacterium]|nr:glycosyltransferase [Candidatus Acidoferrales bacterium]